MTRNPPYICDGPPRNLKVVVGATCRNMEENHTAGPARTLGANSLTRAGDTRGISTEGIPTHERHKDGGVQQQVQHEAVADEGQQRLRATGQQGGAQVIAYNQWGTMTVWTVLQERGSGHACMQFRWDRSALCNAAAPRPLAPHRTHEPRRREEELVDGIVPGRLRIKQATHKVAACVGPLLRNSTEKMSRRVLNAEHDEGTLCWPLALPPAP